MIDKSMFFIVDKHEISRLTKEAVQNLREGTFWQPGGEMSGLVSVGLLNLLRTL